MMRTKGNPSWWAAIFLLALGALGASGDADGPSGYAQALEAAKQDPGSADFARLRMLYTEEEDYSGYPHVGDDYQEHQEAMHEAAGSGDHAGALEHATALLDINYVEIVPHFVAGWAYEGLGDAERSAYHRAFGAGLRDSILNAKTNGAYPVISLTEERAILMHFECYGGYDQSLVSNPDTGTVCDRITCKVGDGEEEMSFMFDITSFFGK